MVALFPRAEQGRLRLLLADRGEVWAGPRLSLLEYLRDSKARLLVAPARDATGEPTAALVARCLSETRVDRAVVVVSTATSWGRDSHAAAAAGAAVLTLPTDEEIDAAISAATDGRSQRALVEPYLAAIPDDLARDVLRRAIFDTRRRVAARAVADIAPVSYRALCRRLRERGLPSPADLAAYGRLARAALLGSDASAPDVARRSGFANVRAWRRVARRLLGTESLPRDPRDLDAVLSRFTRLVSG